MDLQTILNKWVLDQNNYELNLELAEAYTQYNQPSAAIMHYIKTFELVPEGDITEYEVKYHCACMICWLYLKLGHRYRGALQYAWMAQALMPDRPEAYYLHCRCSMDKLNAANQFEQCEWSEVYTAARSCIYFNQSNPAKKSVYFEDIEYAKLWYALSMLRMNKHSELKKYLATTEFKETDNAYIMNSIIYIYGELKMWCPYTSYNHQNNFSSIKMPFPSLPEIGFNSSRMMEDIFALTALNLKGPGNYLEIGFKDPSYGNNTILLEQLGWKGISISTDIVKSNKFNGERNNKCYAFNVTNIDYKPLVSELDDRHIVNYISLDIDSADEVKVIELLLFQNIQFTVLTVDWHGNYAVRNQIRKLLDDNMVLIGPDMKFDLQQSTEDWYINPKYIDLTRYEELDKNISESNGVVSKIFY